MKVLTEGQIDDILKLKYGKLVEDGNHTAYASNATLGKIFGVSGSKIRLLCLRRFEQLRQKSLPLQEQMQFIRQKHERQRWGIRFLKDHEVKWMTSSNTLRA